MANRLPLDHISSLKRPQIISPDYLRMGSSEPLYSWFVRYSFSMDFKARCDNMLGFQAETTREDPRLARSRRRMAASNPLSRGHGTACHSSRYDGIRRNGELLGPAYVSTGHQGISEALSSNDDGAIRMRRMCRLIPSACTVTSALRATLPSLLNSLVLKRSFWEVMTGRLLPDQKIDRSCHRLSTVQGRYGGLAHCALSP